MLSLADPNLPYLFTWLLGALAVFCFLCMIPLRRSEEALIRDKQRLENQIVSQQHDLLVSRSAAAASRLEMQRQFDAFRADASSHLTKTEQQVVALQAQLEETHKQSWKRQSELQASLDRALSLKEGTGIATPVPAVAIEPALPNGSALPVFPALPVLATHADAEKVAELKGALSLTQYKNRRLASVAKSLQKRPRVQRVVPAAKPALEA